MYRKLLIPLIFCLLLTTGTVLGSTLISEWKFEQNLTDTIGSNDGTGYNFTDGYVTGYSGYALNFSETDEQFVDFGNDSSLNFGSDDFKVEAWVWLDEDVTADDNMIITKMGDVGGTLQGWFIMYSTNNVFEIQVADGTLYHEYSWESDLEPDLNKWYNLTFQRIDNDFLLYVNGSLEINETNVNVTSLDTPKNLLMGVDLLNPDFLNRINNGLIDEVKIWTGEEEPPPTTTTTTTTTLSTTTTTPTTTTTTIPSEEGFFEGFLSDIGEGTGNILSNLKDPFISIMLGIALVGFCIFIFYIIADGIEKTVRGKK
jgi:hypothetical protein